MVKILMRADTHLHINQVIKEDVKEEEQIKTYFTWSQVKNSENGILVTKYIQIGSSVTKCKIRTSVSKHIKIRTSVSKYIKIGASFS
jgi:hypothetical protein